MSERGFEGPAGTLSHPEGEPALAEHDYDHEPADAPEAPESPQGDDDDETTPGGGEPADDDDTANGDAVAPPEPVGLTPEQLEQLHKKLEDAAKRWRKKVQELFGEDFAALIECELCGDEIPGYHFPAELLQPENEVQERLLAVLLGPEQMQLRAATDVHACAACDGYGKTLTGSKVPKRTEKRCAACKGYGFVPPPDAPNAPPGLADDVDLLDDLEPEEEEGPAADPWGSPKYLADGQENPNYGRMPQFKSAELP